MSSLAARVALLVAVVAVTAPPAFAGAPKDKLISRVYPVADLVVPLSRLEVGKSEKAEKPATLETRLIQLLTATVQPTSWQEKGGRGVIEYYPLGMSLVVLQTAAVHEQLAELLDTLRKQQDVQVTLEVRLVSIGEGFFERIGVDFSYPTPSDGVYYRPSRQPEREFQQRVLQGQEPAFLKEGDVFHLFEALQGDPRTNIMQAPKVTLFNGQTATVNVTEQHYFVTAVEPVKVNGKDVYCPKVEEKALGFSMSALPVVSADRRSVQVQLKLEQTSLASDTIPLLPITFPVEGSDGKSVPFTQFIQQPKFHTVAFDKVVSIPEGTTAVFGGFRPKVREVRTESGPPVLSRVPYINRLFKNVGIAQETERLLVMVTPRIIVTEEAETKAAVTVAKGKEAVGEEERPGPKTPTVLAEILKAYAAACAAGNDGEAEKLARAALCLDPKCFHKQR